MEGKIEEKEQADDQSEIVATEEDYEDFEESEEYDEDYQDASNEDYGFGGSDPAPLGGIYGLFKETLNRIDSTKVSNLTNEELGIWNLSLRDCKRIALIAKTFKHNGVAKFFERQSRIITDTAMSRKGWFAELFVTSKKYASRSSSSSIPNLLQSQSKNKWKIFSSKAQQPPEME